MNIMNDKLITYENLGRFYDDLADKDITELDSKIAELDGKIGNIIKDTTTANNSTWSSSKINSTINSKTSSLIKNTTTANNSTWSSSKIDSEIQAHSGETYTAGDNINIDSNNVISAIFNLATTAEIEALFAEPTSGQPDNEIWYTTKSGELWEPYDAYNGGDTLQINGNTLLSNTYENGHGVLRYANNITELSDYWGASDGEHNTDITSITFPHSITNIGNIMSYGNSDLNTINYNGTVAECSEIDMPYFMIYSDFSAREIVCTDGVYNPFDN